VWASPFLTALRRKQDLGSVRITHPFHPKYNKEFQVLKTRKVAGRLTLVLQENKQGSFAIAADWTDYFPSDQDVSPPSKAFISAQSLLALCELVKKIDK
jgi:hypothetical protein